MRLTAGVYAVLVVAGLYGCAPHAKLVRYAAIGAPRILGGWEGAAPADICAQITGVSSDMWVGNLEECAQVINRRVHALTVVVELATVVFVGSTVAKCALELALRHTFVGPKATTWGWDPGDPTNRLPPPSCPPRLTAGQ
jgi:hypothetical protein